MKLDKMEKQRKYKKLKCINCGQLYDLNEENIDIIGDIHYSNCPYCGQQELLER